MCWRQTPALYFAEWGKDDVKISSSFRNFKEVKEIEMNNLSSKLINQKGATLIELLVAIFFILVIIIVFTISFRSINLNEEIKMKSAAHFLALGEIETIRKIPFIKLTNRNNANFMGVAYNLGTAEVRADNSAPSLPQVYKLLPSSLSQNNITSLAIIPGNAYQDFTFETMIKVLDVSPLNWQAGFVFRFEDIDNYYYFLFDSSSIKLGKIVNATPSTLYTSSQTFNLNTWYKLKVITNGTSISLYLNDELLSNIIDESLSKGVIGLVGLNSAQISFDDTTIITSSTNTWNFDNDIEGGTASGWERFGLNNLPNGQGKLTIEDYNGHTTLKKITVEVSWVEKQKTKSVKLITLIGQYGLNP